MPSSGDTGPGAAGGAGTTGVGAAARGEAKADGADGGGDVGATVGLAGGDSDSGSLFRVGAVAAIAAAAPVGVE